jgi:hypothetical protein
VSFNPRRTLRLALLAAFVFPSPSSAALIDVRLQAPSSSLAAAPANLPASALPTLPVAAPLAAPLSRHVPPPIAASPSASLSRLASPANGESFPALLDRYFNGALGAPDAESSPLDGERPDFSPAELDFVQRTDRAMTSAVDEAVRAAFPGLRSKVASRGSTARLTHANANPDYDIGVKLPDAVTPEEFQELIARSRDDFTAKLAASAGRHAERLLGAKPETIYVDGPVALTDPATHRINDEALLFHLHVLGRAGEKIKVDVSVTRSSQFSNPYPAYFERQMSQAVALEGPGARERLVSDIRLAKRFFETAVGAYKFYDGGPSALGVEQLIMQSGKADGSDRGATILEPGSFNKMMARLYEASHDEGGRQRTFEQFRDAWTVHSPFTEPANFLELVRRSYSRIAVSARLYREAALASRPVKLGELRATRGRSLPTTAAKLLRAQPGQPPRDVVLVLRRKSGVGFFDRTLRMLENRLAQKVRVLRSIEMKRQVTVTLSIPLNADVQAQVSQVIRFFTRYYLAAELVSVAYADAPKSSVAAVVPEPTAAPTGPASPVARVPQISAPVSDATHGELTRDLLDRFSTSGPRPSSRGEDFLRAQGAATVPQEWIDAWKTPRRYEDSRRPGRDVRAQRGLLLRRGERTYVSIRVVEAGGREYNRQIYIPAGMAQGIVSDTLVDFKYDEHGVLSVRPIGAYLQDMMIGRTFERGGRLWLRGLFRGSEDSVSLYPDLELSGEGKPGRIVQAFVRPNGDRYAAAVVSDLGETITPEIAAREIALRRGARGYFDTDVVVQAEDMARRNDPERDFAALQAKLRGDGAAKTEDLRSLSFITIDPPGAGDLDDAFHVEKHADGSFTWLLATANVAHYVRPGTPAFRSAARVGNTFYSIDKDGISEYPMNHPVVSKNLASLLDGKDSLAMITRMEFDPAGNFLLKESRVSLGLIRVQGRYTYDQVAALWKGDAAHGVAHVEQVSLARELSRKLMREDDKRGKMNLTLAHGASVKREGTWGVERVVEDPLTTESHRLIEELKVYGNREIAVILEDISRRYGIPHISRVHPEQSDRLNERLAQSLKELGVPWIKGTIPEYINELQARREIPEDVKQAAQWLVLTSRQSAIYAADDSQGHEGLALSAGQYDHPSAPIRRFSDMYNRALLETYLEGGNPRETYDAVVKDLKSMGFTGLPDYLTQLNGREQATRQMDYEVEAFMSLVELSKPKYRGVPLDGYVRFARGGRNPSATIELRGSAVTVVLNGPDAANLKLLDKTIVVIRGVDLERRRLDAEIRRAPAPALQKQNPGSDSRPSQKKGRRKGR